MKIINGKEIRNKLEEEYKNKIIAIDDQLTLVVFQVGNNPASDIYVRNKKNLCEKLGITFLHKKYDNITEEDLVKEIKLCNDDKNITGILVQLPLPSYIDETRVIESIDHVKDVDGLTSINMGKLMSGEKSLVPCTALGIVEIFNYENINLEGKNVVIVGRSKLVGLPLIPLFLSENATVTVCHSRTKNLKQITKDADVLVVAVGKKELIKEDFVKDDAIVIDVGINRDENKIYGDCDFNVISNKASYITPVPGGVGPLTVAMLINNVIEAYYLQK